MKRTEKIVNVFLQLKLNQKVPNNFLLVGQKQNLKATVLAIAKVLVCSQHGQCSDHCLSCKNIIRENYDAFLSIKPQTNIIKVEDLKPLFTWMQHLPTNSQPRVYWIAEIDKMNLTVSNQILKFLESHHPQCFGILTTSNLKILLPTIRSRLQIFNLTDNVQPKEKINQLSNLSLQDQQILAYLNPQIHNLNDDFIKKQYLPAKQLITDFFHCLATKTLTDFYLLESYQINRGQFWLFLELLIITIKLIISDSLFGKWRQIFTKNKQNPIHFLNTCCAVYYQNQQFYLKTKNNLNEQNSFLHWLNQIITNDLPLIEKNRII